MCSGEKLLRHGGANPSIKLILPDMLADYKQSATPDRDEQEKLDQFWTENWQSISNRRRPLWRIKAGPEYRLVKALAPSSASGGKVLDGGCGLGEWCLLLNQLGYDAYGLDISTQTVELLQNEFPDMDFVRGDIRDTKFENDFFDFYISWGTFEHFENGLQDCFAEAHRILKTGGKLFITVPFYNGRLKKQNMSGTRTVPDNSEFYQWRLDQRELAEEFQKGGFECDLIKPIYTSEGLRRHLHGTYNMPYNRLTHYLTLGMSAFVPRERFAHMLFGVGTKL